MALSRFASMFFYKAFFFIFLSGLAFQKFFKFGLGGASVTKPFTRATSQRENLSA